MRLEYFNFVILLFFLSLIISKSKEIPDMNLIISYKLNGTASFVSLEYVDPKEKYLYFSFDFKYHSSLVPLNKNKAYFSIESDFELIPQNKEKITFGFCEKKWYEIKNDKDIENVNWKNIDHSYKEKDYYNINYYYEVERTNEKKSTLLLRIPVNERNEGSITIANIEDFSIIKDKMN